MMADERLEMKEEFKMNKNVSMWVYGNEYCYIKQSSSLYLLELKNINKIKHKAAVVYK